MLVLLSFTGCNSSPELFPATGKVIYNGEPLRFGRVMLQPEVGNVSQAEIQPDGTFEVSTYKQGDGIAPGSYRVSVMCYEGHNPAAKQVQSDQLEGMSLGKSLIPLKYTRARSSGLNAAISPDEPNEILLELKGPPPR